MGSVDLDHCVQELPSSSTHKNFIPRSYQVEVFEVAKRTNTIAVLETGAGKTMIAFMLIRHIGEAIKSSDHKKLIIFLAPTVHLVNQQFEVIKSYTDLAVEEYYGAKGIDDWNLMCWEKEIEEHDVMVMTPQILLNGLRKAFLNIETVCLMIIDECHRATGNHPYVKIMKEFYHKSSKKTKIFGMTASPVVRKSVSSTMDCEDQMSTLESILGCQIYTIEDREELELCVPSATETCRFYDQAQFLSQNLKAKIEVSWSKCFSSLLTLQGSKLSQFKDLDEKHEKLRKRLSSDYARILFCLDDLGLICAYEAARLCLENAPNLKEDCELYQKSFVQYVYFLKEVLRWIGEQFPIDNEIFWDSGFEFLKAVELGYTTPKLHELLRIFQSFRETSNVLCLIFVERIVTAKVIERVVKNVKFLSHFTVSYLTGSNTSADSVAPKMQKEILQSFCSGKVNLLFATDVVEEGIHVPDCSCVVRFDLPKTVRSYVQSRGRARQSDSRFIMMLERGNIKQRDHIFNIHRSERSMTETAKTRDPDACILKPCRLEAVSAYTVDATGAVVTADSSASLVYRYCEQLPGDKYFIPKPIFQLSFSGGFYECKLTLPPNAPFQTIIGPLSSNSHLSKQLVCLEACKKLHQMGALNDHLVPSVEEPSENNMIMNFRKTASGEGTTKRKELHGTTCIQAMSGTLGENLGGATFYAYKFDFSCNIIEESYSRFFLLIGSRLDDDVGNVDVDLYLIAKMVKSKISSSGKVHLDMEQMKQAKCFQELFFNGLFGKLFVGSESCGTKREFLLQSATNSLWSSSNMYFLLPLDTFRASTDPWTINWRGINSCASAVDFLKGNPLVGAKHYNGGTENLSPHLTCSYEIEKNISKTIHFANCSVDINDLEDMVVLAIHTGRFYSIVKVETDTSAESPFSCRDAVISDYANYTDYFFQKYGIVLMYPGQPLLRLKQSHNPHNLLVNFNGEGTSSYGDLASEKPQIHAYMPPEILVSIDIPIDVLKSFYLLPSLMHRLGSLMLASQLRKEINFESDCFQIPSSLILEAITTLKCCENFSMERLELLGDSILKYAVSCHLFLRYPEKHEGQLSARRSWVICNSSLHKLGIDRKLQGYIRDSAFHPRRWVAPGQRSVHPVPCECGLNTLEVPLNEKFQTDDPKVKVGLCCDKGHRWMSSKTIADCVEALIGAYYVGGGLVAALHVMKWLGIDVELESSLVVKAITRASLVSNISNTKEIATLELKLGYNFFAKGLLKEAITHASQQELGVGYCYQRLEFLGDSVLGLLITWHLYKSHTDIDPGKITDLRSAAVSNENFAQVAVRRNLQPHLQHCSGFLQSQIVEYVRLLAEPHNSTSLLKGIKAPKALGDMLESIAGAILVDTKLNLDEVWKIFESLLSPIVTPDKLKLPSLRKLNELCDSLGYFVKETCMIKGGMVHAELSLQLEDALLIGNGCEQNRKAAKGEAARCLLEELEKKGIVYSHSVLKRRKHDADHVADSFMDMNTDVFSQAIDEKESSITSIHRKEETAKTQSSAESTVDFFPAYNWSKKTCSIGSATPVTLSINMNKGGARTSLFGLCKTLQWPMPTFKCRETKCRTPIEFVEGSQRRKGFNSFVSKIILHIPNYGIIERTGDPKADKKSSYDSAALVMLYELEKQEKLIIKV